MTEPSEQLRQAEVSRDAYRDERDQTQRERDLAVWLHAEAAWQRDQLQVERDDLDQELDAERITKPTMAAIQEALTAALEAHQSSIVTMDDAGPEFDAQYAARIALDLVRPWGASTSNALSNAALPADWRQRLGECESSGAAVDLVESWLGTGEAVPTPSNSKQLQNLEQQCSCDATGAPEFPHRNWCELNHPHHECDPRSCRFAAVTPAEEARTFGLAAVGCPDGATCFHSCAATCWRVRNCGPLSGVYRDGRWPTGVRIAHEAPDGAGVSGTGTEAAPLADVSPAVDQEAPMQITVTSGGDGGPGVRDINAAFAQHVPEDGAEDDRDTVVDVLTDADEDLHNECGGDGALMNRNYLEYLADRLLARYDIRERGETPRAHVELITLKDTFTGCTDTDPNVCACNDPGLPSCDACSEEIESGQQAYMQSAPGYPWLADDHTDQEYVITWWHVECDQRAKRGDLS